MLPERKGNTYSISFEEVTLVAKEMTLKNGGHEALFIMDGSKHIIAGGVGTLPATHDSRIRLMQSAGRYAARSGEVGRLRQVFMISEGWMSRSKEGKPLKMRPIHDPDRKEVLIVSGLQIQEQLKYLKMFEMKRDQDGRLINLEELIPDTGKNGKIEIPLVDAFAEGFQLAFRELSN